MDQAEINNWKAIAESMEAKGDTESWFYLRARAIAGVGRSVGLSGSWGHYVQVLGWPPTGHLRTVQRRVDCSDVLECLHRRVAHGWVETVGAGT